MRKLSAWIVSVLNLSSKEPITLAQSKNIIVRLRHHMYKYAIHSSLELCKREVSLKSATESGVSTESNYNTGKLFPCYGVGSSKQIRSILQTAKMLR